MVTFCTAFFIISDEDHYKLIEFDLLFLLCSVVNFILIICFNMLYQQYSNVLFMQNHKFILNIFFIFIWIINSLVYYINTKLTSLFLYEKLLLVKLKNKQPEEIFITKESNNADKEYKNEGKNSISNKAYGI